MACNDQLRKHSRNSTVALSSTAVTSGVCSRVTSLSRQSVRHSLRHRRTRHTSQLRHADCRSHHLRHHRHHHRRGRRGCCCCTSTSGSSSSVAVTLSGRWQRAGRWLQVAVIDGIACTRGIDESCSLARTINPVKSYATFRIFRHFIDLCVQHCLYILDDVPFLFFGTLLRPGQHYRTCTQCSNVTANCFAFVWNSLGPILIALPLYLFLKGIY